MTRDDITRQLGALGIQNGAVLLVHTSFRAVRPMEGGPRGLVEALRAAVGPEGTVVMPSWTGRDDEPFDKASTPASPDLGVVADTFWRSSGVLRSEHLFAFAAVGPHAERIVSGPLPVPPHKPGSPVGQVHDLDGQVLLLGVGHDANTTLHLAELVAGVPYRSRQHCTVLEAGHPVRFEYDENNHCCQNFTFADTWLRGRGLQLERRVGNAHARLMRSRDIVRVAVEHLAQDPLLFLHPPGAGCAECDEARLSTVTTRSAIA